jgi:Na+-driven multidrug efflux pump
MLIEINNLIFIGHTSNPKALIAGVGLGNMIQNICCLSIIFGSNSALGTFVSTAAGAGNIELCGLYTNRGRFIMTILFIPIAFVLTDVKSLILLLNRVDMLQSEEVAYNAQKYVLVQLPGMYIFGLNNIQTILL